jgi:hypothetical protein
MSVAQGGVFGTFRWWVLNVTHINPCIVGDTSVRCTCICGHSTNQSCCAYQLGRELKGFPYLLCLLDLNLEPGLLFSHVVSQGMFFCSLHSKLEPGLIFFSYCWCLSSDGHAMLHWY